MTTSLRIITVFAIMLISLYPVHGESGHIAINKKNLDVAVKRGVKVKVTHEQDDRYHVEIWITRVSEKARYRLVFFPALLKDKSRIRLEQLESKGVIYSDHWLSREVMSKGVIYISGLTGRMIDSPDNNMLIELKSFVTKN